MKYSLLIAGTFFGTISLEICAQSTTVLPNAVELPKFSTNPTCNSNETGKLIYNTTANKSYYCNGTNWVDMSAGGLTLPYTSSNSNPSALFSIINTNGRAIYGESTNGTGVYAKSANDNAFNAISTNRIGAYIESTNNSAGFAALYVQQYGTDKAAIFNGGDVSMNKNLIVNGTASVENGKGIVRSSNATQLKVVRISATLTGNNLASGSFLEGGALNYEDFSGIPTIVVGQVNSSAATGDWHKVMVVPINVSATQCEFRITNLSSSTATFSATWSILAIGPK